MVKKKVAYRVGLLDVSVLSVHLKEGLVDVQGLFPMVVNVGFNASFENLFGARKVSFGLFFFAFATINFGPQDFGEQSTFGLQGKRKFLRKGLEVNLKALVKLVLRATGALRKQRRFSEVTQITYMSVDSVRINVFSFSDIKQTKVLHSVVCLFSPLKKIVVPARSEDDVTSLGISHAAPGEC